MHWLIPTVSHSLSGLLAWRQNTITVTGVVLSIALAASQSIHLWAAHYGLFALVFLGRIGVGARAQDAQSQARARSALRLLISVLVPAALVPLHQYYLKLRLTTVPWFHTFRSPGGCLPVPSRTLTQPFKYNWIDALGNQLPYGIVASYAVTMAHLLSGSSRKPDSKGNFGAVDLTTAVSGALMAASLAAYALPLCGKDEGDGSHHVAMHFDRSVGWDERESMTWSTTAKYGWLIVPLTAIGTLGAALTAVIVNKPSAASARSSQADKPSVKAVSWNEKAIPQASKSTQLPDSPSEGATATVEYGDDLTCLLVNVLLTIFVIVCMAVWSWSGPHAKQERTLLGIEPVDE